MKEYKSRIVEQTIKRKLKGKGAVLIEGPKWCGKTTTGEKLSKSVLYMANPETFKNNIMLADIKPNLLLEGENPRLIDEWQLAPNLWDAVRYEVDHRKEFGSFILTGSSVPVNSDKIFHSGAGRFAWITMRTMSLFESSESTGDVSLSDLFNQKNDISGTNKLSIEDIAYLVCRGGWPNSIFMEKDIALDQAADYCEALIKSDISKVDNVQRNPYITKLLLKAYSRNVGTQVSNENLKNDIINNDVLQINIDTMTSYINALKKMFVIEDCPAWNPNLRSKIAIRTTATKYFTDPSIAAASLKIGPNDLISDLNTFGFLFESLCIRDLRIYAESIEGEVFHYKDSNDLECDAVVHLKDSSYGLIEIKLGTDDAIEEAVKNLKKLEAKIDTTKMKNPSFLMVLTATSPYAFRREDGVYIVPIGCLKN